MALLQWLRPWRLGRFGLSKGRKKHLAHFGRFRAAKRHVWNARKKAFAFLDHQDKKLLPSLALWFAHWQWRVWPWLALAEAAESVYGFLGGLKGAAKGSTPKVVPGAALAMAKPGSADIGIQTRSGRYPFIAKFMRIQRLRWRIAQPSCQVELPKPVVISSDIA